jgi:hypothetical protein
MKKTIVIKLALAGGVLALIITSIWFIMVAVGNRYQSSLSALEQQAKDVSHKKKKNIRRITVQKEGEKNCLEVTPDGVVRVYSSCGSELENAHRPNDPKYVLNLFRVIREAELDLLRLENNIGGEIYKITVETDEGTQTYYIAANGSGSIDEIIQTIISIQGNLPGASTSPFAIPYATPISSPISNPSITPPQTSPIPGASPGSGGGSGDSPFTCDFNESGSNIKPYRVSNIVCSSEPLPVP